MHKRLLLLVAALLFSSLALADEATLGAALRALLEADVDLFACRHERPEVEEAFLALLGEAEQ